MPRKTPAPEIGNYGGGTHAVIKRQSLFGSYIIAVKGFYGIASLIEDIRKTQIPELDELSRQFNIQYLNAAWLSIFTILTNGGYVTSDGDVVPFAHQEWGYVPEYFRERLKTNSLTYVRRKTELMTEHGFEVDSWIRGSDSAAITFVHPNIRSAIETIRRPQGVSFRLKRNKRTFGLFEQAMHTHLSNLKIQLQSRPEFNGHQIIAVTHKAVLTQALYKIMSDAKLITG